MAVELNVEFEESPQLDMDLNILQFVGIADHSQLRNREMADQHPLGAITGLIEKHEGYDKAISEIETNIGEQAQILLAFDETLTEHTQTLSSLGEALGEHSQQISEQGESIESIETVLQEQALSLEELEAFKGNIATENDLQEVLANG